MTTDKSIKPSASFRICIALDVTGSMGSEIEGCKVMIKNFVQLCDGADMPINLCLMTFTEGSTGCYVSSREFEGLDIPLAVEHVDSWKLGVPPDHPNISACGDDGAENQKAALEKLKDLSPLPTLLFLITDAPPHMAADSATPTSRAEMRWLQERGVSDLVAGDVFRLFDSVLDHYDRENLIFNGVVFSGQAQSGVYASMARRTGGLLMEPTSRSPITLASGLMTVVKALLSQLPGALPANNNTGTTAAVPPGEITGYNLYDVSHVALRETESDPAGSPPVVGDNIEIFRIAMDRIVEVCGRKWTKRAIGMSAAAEQLEFVWRTARFVVGHESEGRGELSYLLKLREKILQELPAEVRGHFSIDERDIEGLARLGVSSRGDNEEWGDLGAGISAISLQTVGEALAEDAEWTDWLATIMALLTGFPMQLQLPKDRMGKPDFADAWSAVTLALGVDRMSASDFMQLLSAEGGGAMTGPTDRHAGYNAFLTLPHPSDAAAAIVYKIASGTQVLNYVTGVAMGANGFLPNLAPGCAAACLMRLLSSPTPLSSFQQAQARQIVHSLRLLHRTPAAAVQRQLASGTANPSDSISKLVTALVRLSNRKSASPGDRVKGGEKVDGLGARALRLVLEEWMAAILQRFYGKGPESDASYLASLASYLPSGSILSGGDAEIDPLKELHVLESKDAVNAVVEGWEDLVFERMRGGGGEGGVNPPPHPSVRAFVSGARALLSLLHASSSEGPGSSQGSSDDGKRDLLEEVWPGWNSAMVRSLLLRFRTARYRVRNTSEDDGIASTILGSSETQWEAAEVPESLVLALGRLKEVHAARLKSYREARDAEARDKLLDAAARIVKNLLSPELQIVGEVEADREARASEALASLYLHLDPPSSTASSGPSASNREGIKRPADASRGPIAVLLRQQVKLDRSSVPQILKRITVNDAHVGSILRLLVAADWTPSPPQALKRSIEVLEMCRRSPDLTDLLSLILSAETCQRPPPGYNRHGHSSDRQYPGPAGWTLEYSTLRIAAMEGGGRDRRLRKAKGYVEKMKLFTEMANQAIQAAGEVSQELVVKVESVLMGYRDANVLEAARFKLRELLIANGCSVCIDALYR